MERRFFFVVIHGSKKPIRFLVVWQRAKQTASHVFSFFLFYKLVYLLALMLSPAVNDRERDRVKEMNIAYPAHAFVAGPDLGRFFGVT